LQIALTDAQTSLEKAQSAHQDAVNTAQYKLDTEIKKILDETPNSENIVEQMQLSSKLEPLHEKRDLLKLRYLRYVERIFDKLIVNEVE